MFLLSVHVVENFILILQDQYGLAVKTAKFLRLNAL